MLTTRYRTKLSRDFSYPIGTEALGLALDGAPHLDSFELSYHDRAVWRGTEFRRLIVERRPYSILNLSYTPKKKPGLSASNDFIEDGWYEAKWSLTVYAVARELRRVANLLLVDQGLPAVVRWLDGSKRSGWDERPHSINLVYRQADGLIEAEEWDGV